MNVVEFIREKKEHFQQNNAKFIAQLEPKFRDLSDKLNHKITNTLNNPWFSRFNPFEDEQNEEKPLIQTAEVKKMYANLEKKIGEETYLGEWFIIDQSCIDQFAQVTGDKQWIHTDPERAKKESPFRTTIAHGFLTLALIPTLTETVDPEKNPYPEAKMIMNYGLNQVRFPVPVKSGLRVRARTRLIGLVPMKRSIEVVNEISIEIENSSKPACVAETVLRLYF
ncbi:MAG: protein dehydratase [Gammaproteobacteria bacterium CG22_combo_CG10-13_8_21_14_all_40_8]|nr:MAG: protein dehydratase [Gammaproteobacteria bacterium CG22_combo_CG10-13_8_21_14_all_40_8]